MIETPLLRAARALMKAHSDVDDLESLDADTRASLLEDARAVLTAVRTPSAPMFRAADEAYANRADATSNVVLFDEDYTTIFTAMIDAASEGGA
jgi:hypothetical protein